MQIDGIYKEKYLKRHNFDDNEYIITNLTLMRNTIFVITSSIRHFVQNNGFSAIAPKLLKYYLSWKKMIAELKTKLA